MAVQFCDTVSNETSSVQVPATEDGEWTSKYNMHFGPIINGHEQCSTDIPLVWYLGIEMDRHYTQAMCPLSASHLAYERALSQTYNYKFKPDIRYKIG